MRLEVALAELPRDTITADRFPYPYLQINPEDMAELNLKEGDKFYPVEQPDGSLRLSPFNPKHARTMEIARKVMHEYRDTFAALAK
jgi:hypothetical protein